MERQQDPEITLAWRDQRAVVAPLGASLRRYYRLREGGGEVDVAWGYQGREGKRGGQGDVLIPFPGRVKGGRYAFKGVEHQMPINDKEGPNAIHGFLRELPWDSEQPNDAEARFHFAMDAKAYEKVGYPFSLDVALRYALRDEGLVTEFRVRNTGDGPAPVGVGFHPYFVVGTDSVDEMSLTLPADRYLEFDKGMMPTGELLPLKGSPVDFGRPKAIGKTRINHCFADLIADADGLIRVRMEAPSSGRKVTVWMDANFPYLVVYTGDAIEQPYARRALAVEPMTCATDAFNHPDWGLVRLLPGQEFRGRWGVQSDEVKR
ncbi:MAG TPA: galactose mutarotase [Armatimonadota bacterium]